MPEFYVELDYGHGGSETISAASLEEAKKKGTEWAQDGDWEDPDLLCRLAITSVDGEELEDEIVWHVPCGTDGDSDGIYYAPDGSINMDP